MGGQHFSSLVSLAFVCLVSEKISPTTTRRKKEWENGERKERQKIQPTRFHWIRCSSRTCHKPRNLRRQRPHQEKKAQRSFFFFFFPEIYFLPNTSSFCIVHPPFLFNVFLDCMCWCWIAPDLAGSNVRVNLSVPEILQLANSIISKSKAVHDAVGSVPLDKVMRVQCYFLCELFSRCGNIKLLLLLDSFDY